MVEAVLVTQLVNRDTLVLGVSTIKAHHSSALTSFYVFVTMTLELDETQVVNVSEAY